MNSRPWRMGRGSSSSSPVYTNDNSHFGFAAATDVGVGARVHRDDDDVRDDDARDDDLLVAQHHAALSGASSSSSAMVKHKRRYCKVPGCKSIVKSQGLCQRHGAKPRECKVAGCGKQAQGNFDGMCKKHFKHFKQDQQYEQQEQEQQQDEEEQQCINDTAANTMASPTAAAAGKIPSPRPASPQTPAAPPTVVESVYDRIIPASIAFSVNYSSANRHSHRHHHHHHHDAASSAEIASAVAVNTTMMMPLVAHLKAGFEDASKSLAWHRNEERMARGLSPVTNLATQLENWERSLVFTEYLLLLNAVSGHGNAAGIVGNVNAMMCANNDISFRHLARAWGRDKGFHIVVAQSICERRGDVERKKKSSPLPPSSQQAASKKRRGAALESGMGQHG
jgi:hypothetical protein